MRVAPAPSAARPAVVMSTNSPPVNGNELGSGALVSVVPLTEGVDAEVGSTCGVLDSEGVGVGVFPCGLVGGLTVVGGVVVGAALVVTAGAGVVAGLVVVTG